MVASEAQVKINHIFGETQYNKIKEMITLMPLNKDECASFAKIIKISILNQLKTEGVITSAEFDLLTQNK